MSPCGLQSALREIQATSGQPGATSPRQPAAPSGTRTGQLYRSQRGSPANVGLRRSHRIASVLSALLSRCEAGTGLSFSGRAEVFDLIELPIELPDPHAG